MNTFGYKDWQVEDIRKCSKSFPYFCENFIKIIHPIKGLIPFKLYQFQERVILDYEKHPYNIVSKFRQAGLTTVTVIWSLWRCLFKTDQRIMILSKSDREAIGIGKIVQNAKDNLPDWMQPTMRNDNDHEKEFADTGGVMWFFTVQGVRSRALTYLIIDEAAFIPNMEEYWKAMYPALSTGGKCIAISTVNGIGNWYEETYTRATEKKNLFHVIDLDYTEHPDYNNSDWVKRTRANLGEKGFLQEVLRSFLGSGETYIDAKIITEYEKGISDPKRKLFPEWDSSREENWDQDELFNEDYEKGAMWIWKEPEANREYIIAADASEGVGNDGDNSAFHVIDIKTLDQVGEFYSNMIPPHKFAQVLAQVSIFYNNALLVVENDTGPGLSTLNRLEHTLYYDNIYYTSTGNKDKAGVTLNKTNRPVVLETMQTCLIQNLVTIHSLRFIRELKTFIFNRQKQRAEAQKGKHDDLVLSYSLALNVSDVLNRHLPVGLNEKDMNGILEESAISRTFRGAAFDAIKLELEKGLPDDFLADEFMEEEDLFPNIIGGGKGTWRTNDRILREFGW